MPWRPNGGVEVQLYISLTSDLDGVGGQRHAPAALPPIKKPDTHCEGGWEKGRHKTCVFIIVKITNDIHRKFSFQNSNGPWPHISPQYAYCLIGCDNLRFGHSVRIALTYDVYCLVCRLTTPSANEIIQRRWQISEHARQNCCNDGRRTPVPVPFWLPQIPHVLVRDWTLVSALTDD